MDLSGRYNIMVSGIKRLVTSKQRMRQIKHKLFETRNTMESMKLTDVPGLIMSKTEIVKEKFMENSFMKDDKTVISLMILANSLSKKILDKKLPKEQMCFILISLIGSLGLSDGDFKNFHQKHNPNFMHDDEDD
jgi:hypothetical protein